MTKRSKWLAVGLFSLSAAVWATCDSTPKPMPPFQVKAGWLDYAIAWVQDYKNPLNAAVMKEVDEAGESMFGESGWKDTAFRGYIYITNLPSALRVNEAFRF